MGLIELFKIEKEEKKKVYCNRCAFSFNCLDDNIQWRCCCRHKTNTVISALGAAKFKEDPIIINANYNCCNFMHTASINGIWWALIH